MASSFNKVILMGNLTRDPQLKYLPSQLPVAEFGIAMNRRFKTAAGEDRDEVTFVDISAFGKTGEFINTYFTKGKSILIEGRLKYDQWEDKNGGGKKSKLSVVAETVSFVGPKDGGGGGGGGYDPGPGPGGDDAQASAPRPAPSRPQPTRPPATARPAPQQQPPPEQPFGEEQQFKEDDIPF